MDNPEPRLKQKQSKHGTKYMIQVGAHSSARVARTDVSYK
jgi:hypothetical protein